MTAGEGTGKLHNAYQLGVNCTPGPFRGGEGQTVAYQLSSGIWFLAQGNNKK